MGERLCPTDWEILHIWAEHGIPMDQSTLDAAQTIIKKLLNERDVWAGIKTELSAINEEEEQ